MMKPVNPFEVDVNIDENEEEFFLEDDEEEIAGLLHHRPTIDAPQRRATSAPKKKKRRISTRFKVFLVFLFMVVVFVSTRKKGSRIDADVVTKDENDVDKAEDHSHECRKHLEEPIILTSLGNQTLEFACPCEASEKSFHSIRHKRNKQKVKIDNVTAYLEVFRDMEFDDWGHSYSEVESSMKDWKVKYFGEHLRNNSTIYESGCGTGLNLFMTLNILHEAKGLKNLVVYGSDFSGSRVKVANEIGERNAFPAGGRLGSICPGDATNLLHVPSNSFDLVFTSYIAPLIDPLGIVKNSSIELDPFSAYSEICDDKDNPDSVHKKREAQHSQDRWFSHWVGEMIRIAKPGSPVIAEQVSYPYVSISCNG